VVHLHLMIKVVALDSIAAEQLLHLTYRPLLISPVVTRNGQTMKAIQHVLETLQELQQMLVSPEEVQAVLLQ
jgi:hypothetical protein